VAQQSALVVRHTLAATHAFSASPPLPPTGPRGRPAPPSPLLVPAAVAVPMVMMMGVLRPASLAPLMLLIRGAPAPPPPAPPVIITIIVVVILAIVIAVIAAVGLIIGQVLEEGLLEAARPVLPLLHPTAELL
jgi:hypothetical protein